MTTLTETAGSKKRPNRVNVGIPNAEHAEHLKIQTLLRDKFPSLQDATTDAIRRWNKQFAGAARKRASEHAATLGAS